MAFKCDCCEDAFDDDDQDTLIRKASFKKTGLREAEVNIEETLDVCEGCRDSEGFYCAITDENYWDGQFCFVTDENGDTICENLVEVLGMRYDDDNDHYVYPKEDDEPKESKAVAEYVDFYWELRDGDRHGVLQKDGGGEKHMSESLEQIIYKRIEEAGADKGDPSVVNVYTRLELIERDLLPKDYVL